MGKVLTIGEIEEMDIVDLDEIMTFEERERINALGITVEQFLSEFKDNATLSGEEDNKEFMTISDFIAHLEEIEKQMNEEIGNIETIGNTSNELTVSESQNNQLSEIIGGDNGFNKPDIVTNINDKKLIFNLGKKVDKLLNDCEGHEITIDKVLIKKYQKIIDEPQVDEQTGQIISDTTTKTSMSVVIVDKEGISYATGSLIFGYSLLNAIYDFGKEIEGLKIRIIKTLRSGNKNKSLDFEIV